MPTFQENIIGGGTKQFEWDSGTGIFSKKPNNMTDAQAMDYVNKSREESRQQDRRNRPPKRGRERAAEAFKDMKHGGSVKKYAKGGGVRKARYK